MILSGVAKALAAITAVGFVTSLETLMPIFDSCFGRR